MHLHTCPIITHIGKFQKKKNLFPPGTNNPIYPGPFPPLLPTTKPEKYIFVYYLFLQLKKKKILKEN